MVRAQRLLALMQLLRSHRRPVSAQNLSQRLGISLRTLYRDIETLRQQGADIVGEAGVGYQLKPGFLLPPLMLTEEEIEALVLGARWVGEHASQSLGQAAESAAHKIRAVLPASLQEKMDDGSLMVGHGAPLGYDQNIMDALLLAMRKERKISVRYIDEKGEPTKRTIWPFAIGFFEQVRIAAAWCEMRADYRHFRLDRIKDLTVLADPLPKRKAVLMREWKKTCGIP